jgi:hypothetical protein
MWLIGKAHTAGTLPRRALVLVAVRCVECVAHLLADDSLPHLATLSSWAHGADDVTAEDLEEAWRVLANAAKAAAAAAAKAAAAAAAYDAGAAAVARAIANAAYAAYAYAANSAAYAANSAAYAAAVSAYDAADADADVIRDAITLKTVCSALGLDPDEVL